MRIISCHIENFGRLHDYDHTFTEGDNVICAENGWGKSTFAAFVRAMFYGLAGERKHGLENERKFYKPWQGGSFGGRLVFESSKGRFLVERTFADKESGDIFRLRDAVTNLESDIYSAKLGEELFGIDRNSFMRTVFIGQNDCVTEVTDDINARIGDLVDNARDMNCFEAATKKLEEVLNKLNPSRITGSINRRKSEIQTCERLEREGSSIETALNATRGLLEKEKERYRALDDELKANNEEQKRKKEERARIIQLQKEENRRQDLKRLYNAVSASTAEAETARSAFPGEMPDMDTVNAVLEECTELTKASERVKTLALSDADGQELQSLRTEFADGSRVPDSADIEDRLKTATQMNELSGIYAGMCLNGQERARLNELEATYGAVCEDAGEISGLWNVRCRKKDPLTAQEKALSAMTTAFEEKRTAEIRKYKSPVPAAAITVGAVILAVGICLAVMGTYVVPGYIAAVAGLITAAAGAAGLVHNARMRQSLEAAPASTPDIETLKAQIAETISFADSAENRVRNFLKSCGRDYSETTVGGVLQDITDDTKEYSSLKKKAAAAEASGYAERLANMETDITQYLADFGVYTDVKNCRESLYALKDRTARFKALRQRRAEYDGAAEDYDRLAGDICAFIKKCGFEPEDNLNIQITHIRDMLDDALDALKIKDKAVAELEGYKTQNGLTDGDVQAMLSGGDEPKDGRLAGDAADDSSRDELTGIQDTEELEARLTRLESELTRLDAGKDEIERKKEETDSHIRAYNKRIDEDSAHLDELEENRQELGRLKELQAIEEEKHRLVGLAKEKLTLAKTTLTGKYSQPLRDSFGHYYGLIARSSADAYHLDADIKLTVDECGLQRDISSLSAGWKDLFGIALRISLTDAMYKDEKPVIIMDDPFVNLDDDKVHAARQFMADVAEGYQVIYFTCSSSRSLGYETTT